MDAIKCDYRKILRQPTPSVVFLKVDSCPFCRDIQPVIEAVERHLQGFNIPVVSISFSSNPEFWAFYPVDYEVPELLVFKDGHIVGAILGAFPAGTKRLWATHEILSKLNEILRLEFNVAEELIGVA